METNIESKVGSTKAEGKLATYAKKIFMIVIGALLVLAVCGAIYRRLIE
jgi:hypothetical protein